ncbi:MAG: lamin tail domain-containing protein [Phycisphaeraceae bacterium]|nr:lamin tail domain-containing protein [Phycisphaeraceae bacterium]
MRKHIVCAGMAALAAAATADVTITETYIGIDGPDGTADWLEVTNTGPGSIDTATYWFDDVSADISEAGNLDSFILGPGESAIFLISTDGGEVGLFAALWGAVANVGLTNGGGSLGQGGDALNLMLGDGTVIDNLTYDASLASNSATIERLPGEAARISVLGENGAYESDPFFNDTIGQPPDFLITLVGSPGLLPAPSSLALLGLGGLALGRRRR